MKTHLPHLESVPHLVAQMGGWQVGSKTACEHAYTIDAALAYGLVDYRMHYAMDLPNGTKAYELTDDGINYLREWCGDGGKMADSALIMRNWYREHSSSFEKAKKFYRDAGLAP